MAHTLLLHAHPRTDSLTRRTTDRVQARLTGHGRTVDHLDLYGEGFDPLLRPADEPDWQDRDKVYSPEVQRHMERVLAADEIVLVFPLWWFSPPAILRGWIERVWNYGFAYGRSTPRLAGKRVLWLGLAGGSDAEFTENGVYDHLSTHLDVLIAGFCGITDSRVRLLLETELSGVPAELRAERVAGLLATAEREVDAFLAAAPVGAGAEAGVSA